MSSKYVPPHRRDDSSPSHHNESDSKSDVIDVVADTTIAVPEVKDEWPKERVFFRKLARIRVHYARKAKEAKYNNWMNQHDAKLKIMYNECVPPELLISYERFSHLAYVCSE